MERIFGVGVIGCGHVSAQYIRNMRAFSNLNVLAVSDVEIERAHTVAAEFKLRAVHEEEMLANPEIQIIVNLTVPAAHKAVTLKAISAGKHVYSEKPLAPSLREAGQILKAAEKMGVLVGCAPDNFLSPAVQAAKQIIETGGIGEPIGASAFVVTFRPESFHPNPQYLFDEGGGPLYDLAPYSLASLAYLLGSAVRVSGSMSILIQDRKISIGPHAGSSIRVNVPTHVNAQIDYISGAAASITASFDMWASTQPFLEIFGRDGTITLTGQDKFSSPVRIRCENDTQWTDIPLDKTRPTGRGLGVAALAHAIQEGTQPAASGKLAYHQLEIMHAIEASVRSGKKMRVKSRCPSFAYPASFSA